MRISAFCLCNCINLRSLLFACALLILTQNGVSNEKELLTPQRLHGGFNLETHFIIEEKNELSLSQVLALPPTTWSTSKTPSLSYGFSTRPYWFRSLAVEIGNDISEVFFEIGFPLLDHITLYARTNSSNPWQKWDMGDRLRFKSRPYPNRNFVIPISVKAGDSLELIVRVQTSGSMRFQGALRDRATIVHMQSTFLLANGIYIGLMAGLFIIYLIFFLALREYIYIYFAAWILVMAFFIVSHNGLASQYIWPLATYWNDWSRVVFLLLSTGLFVSFTIEFLKVDSIFPKWSEARLWPILIFITIASITPFVSPYFSVYLAYGIQFVLIVICYVSAVFLAKAGHAHAKIFVLTFTGVLFGAVVLASDMCNISANLKELSDLELAPQVGSAVSVILFSYALARRLQEERQQRLIAENLRRSNEVLEASMLAERDRSNALLELRLQAERRDKGKSKFLADVVHDLRQPLQAVSNSLHPINNAIRNGNVKDALRLLRLADDAAKNMRSQLSQVLNLSRLESGLVNAEIVDIDLILLLKEVVYQIKTGCSVQNISIELDNSVGKDVYVQSDRHFLFRIFSNLIDNSIKYRRIDEANPFVKVFISIYSNSALVTVQDNGVGIPDDILRSDLIFNPFFQLENHLAEAEKGVGLGLSIVAAMLRLLEDHSIKVTSQMGIGSKFIVEIPISSYRPPLQINIFEEHSRTEISAAFGIYVIVLEDDTLIRDSLAAMLSSHGIIYEAWSSLEQMEAHLGTVERKPDILLTDYRLPNARTALDAMEIMLKYWSDVPTIVVTGQSFSIEEIDAMSDTTICYKPIDPLLLLHRIIDISENKTPPSNFGLL